MRKIALEVLEGELERLAAFHRHLGREGGKKRGIRSGEKREVRREGRMEGGRGLTSSR